MAERVQAASAENAQSAFAVRATDLTKAYRHYARTTDRVVELLTGGQRHQAITSVSGASFDIPAGQVVGIIGRNGAGKSTLLKMLAGRLEPSRGKVETRGSIAAILELGSGFHPDFSGRENVVLGGMCMGLSKRQVLRQMDDIVAFAELEDVIDMPFRTYSSGMQARLTFATAVVVDPDLLIVDEALSVGDNRFQLKSFNRLREFKGRGKTIIIVTHNTGSVTSFCDRAILLEQGRIVADGDPTTVTAVYHNLQFGTVEYDEAGWARLPESSNAAERVREGRQAGTEGVGAQSTGGETGHTPVTPPNPRGDDAQQVVLARPAVFPFHKPDPKGHSRGVQQGYRYGDGRATLLGVSVLDRTGCGPISEVVSGETYQVVLDCQANEDVERLYCGILVRDVRGETLFGLDTKSCDSETQKSLINVQKGEVRRLVVSVRMWLAAGEFFLTGAVATGEMSQSDMWFDAYEFRVTGTPTLHTNSVVNLQPNAFLFTDNEGSA
jgi:lipopolysaccharide transport system ATP-binding protein